MGKKNQTYTGQSEISVVKELAGIVFYILFIVVAIWAINTFVGQRTEVSGDSMNDTLMDGDSLWIDKFTYRIKDPERFDVVVFPYHVGGEDEEEEKSVYFIKRIIGLPGERLRIETDGTIYINNEPLEEEYGLEPISPNTIGRTKSNIILGEDEYFVMGDNRNNSRDSRFEDVGNISREDLEGKAAFRIWPLNKFGKIK